MCNIPRFFEKILLKWFGSMYFLTKRLKNGEITETIKILKEEKQLYKKIHKFFETLDFSDEDRDKIDNFVSHNFTKNRNSSNFQKIKLSFIKIKNHFLSQNYLKHFTKQKVSLKNEKQKQKLLEIYNSFEFDVKSLNKDFKGEIWIDLGFQGEDPTTDFRGTGELGLINLNFFCLKKKKESFLIFQDSIKKESFYFFACAGINITFEILKVFDNCLLGFENSNDKENCILRSNQIYCKVFEKFHRFWMESDMKGDVMNFNIALKEFFLKNKYQLIN